MLEMVKEGLGNEEYKEKNDKTSRIFWFLYLVYFLF